MNEGRVEVGFIFREATKPGRLSGAQLKKKNPLLCEKRGGFFQYPTIKSGPFFRCEKGLFRFMIANLRRKGGPVTLRDIRRIANNQIEAAFPRSKRREEIPLNKTNPVEISVSRRIRGGGRQRNDFKVGGNDRGFRKYRRQGDRKRPAPGAEIEDSPGRGDKGAGRLDDQFGLGPRDKDTGTNLEGESAEFNVAGNILNRLMVGAAGQSCPEEGLLIRRNRPIRFEVKIKPTASKKIE